MKKSLVRAIFFKPISDNRCFGAYKDITRTKRLIGSHDFLCATARINLNCPTLFSDLEFDCVEFFYVFHNEVEIAVCDVNVFLIASDCG